MELQVEATLALKYWNDPILSTVCEPVRDSEFGEKLQLFANKLEAKMHEHGGVGLAAPQLGIPIRMFSMRSVPGGGSKVALTACNPTLKLWGDSVHDREGCLSLPGIFESVARSQQVALHYFDPLGGEHEIPLAGMDARIAQHETDHLDGIMFFDRRRVSKQVSKAVERSWEKQRAKLKLR
jgi:peptide deformylase